MLTNMTPKPGNAFKDAEKLYKMHHPEAKNNKFEQMQQKFAQSVSELKSSMENLFTGRRTLDTSNMERVSSDAINKLKGIGGRSLSAFNSLNGKIKLKGLTLMGILAFSGAPVKADQLQNNPELLVNAIPSIGQAYEANQKEWDVERLNPIGHENFSIETLEESLDINFKGQEGLKKQWSQKVYNLMQSQSNDISAVKITPQLRDGISAITQEVFGDNAEGMQKAQFQAMDQAMNKASDLVETEARQNAELKADQKANSESEITKKLGDLFGAFPSLHDAAKKTNLLSIKKDGNDAQIQNTLRDALYEAELINLQKAIDKHIISETDLQNAAVSKLAAINRSLGDQGFSTVSLERLQLSPTLRADLQRINTETYGQEASGMAERQKEALEYYAANFGRTNSESEGENTFKNGNQADLENQGGGGKSNQAESENKNSWKWPVIGLLGLAAVAGIGLGIKKLRNRGRQEEVKVSNRIDYQIQPELVDGFDKNDLAHIQAAINNQSTNDIQTRYTNDPKVLAEFVVFLSEAIDNEDKPRQPIPIHRDEVAFDNRWITTKINQFIEKHLAERKHILIEGLIAHYAQKGVNRDELMGVVEGNILSADSADLDAYFYKRGGKDINEEKLRVFEKQLIVDTEEEQSDDLENNEENQAEATEAQEQIQQLKESLLLSEKQDFAQFGLFINKDYRDRYLQELEDRINNYFDYELENIDDSVDQEGARQDIEFIKYRVIQDSVINLIRFGGEEQKSQMKQLFVSEVEQLIDLSEKLPEIQSAFEAYKDDTIVEGQYDNLKPLAFSLYLKKKEQSNEGTSNDFTLDDGALNLSPFNEADDLGEINPDETLGGVSGGSSERLDQIVITPEMFQATQEKFKSGYGVEIKNSNGQSAKMTYGEARELIKNSREITIGDLHGSALKLVEHLVMTNQVYLSPEDFEQFADIYVELQNESADFLYPDLPREDDPGYQDALDNVNSKRDSFIANHQSLMDIIDQMNFDVPDKKKLRLIGDVLYDRGVSDLVTMKLIAKMRESNEVQVLFSNHDSFSANMGLGSLMPLDYLSQLIARKVDPGLYKSMRTEYLSQLELFDYDVQNNDFFSHAFVPNFEDETRNTYIKALGMILGFDSLTPEELNIFRVASNNLLHEVIMAQDSYNPEQAWQNSSVLNEYVSRISQDQTILNQLKKCIEEINDNPSIRDVVVPYGNNEELARKGLAVVFTMLTWERGGTEENIVAGVGNIHGHQKQSSTKSMSLDGNIHKPGAYGKIDLVRFRGDHLPIHLV